MAASRWSESITYDLNVLLLKQRISPIKRCINQRVRVTRAGARCTTRRTVSDRLQTAVLPMITKQRTLHMHDLTHSNTAVSQHLLWRHKAVAYEELDKNIVTGNSSSLLVQSCHAQHVFNCAIVNRRSSTLVSTHTPLKRPSFSPGESTVEFSAEQSEGAVKIEHPNDPTPTQLSFVLLKLREEVSVLLGNYVQSPCLFFTACSLSSQFPHLLYPHYHLDVYIYSRDVKLENKLLSFLPTNMR